MVMARLAIYSLFSGLSRTVQSLNKHLKQLLILKFRESVACIGLYPLIIVLILFYILQIKSQIVIKIADVTFCILKLRN